MSTLVIALNHTLLAAHRGQRWHLESSLEGKRFTCAVADPHRPGRVYCGTVKEGMWRSDNSGRSWDRVHLGPGSGHITALAVDRHERDRSGGTLYLGTEPSRFFRSSDGGETWEELQGLTALSSSKDWSFPPRPHTHHVRWIEPDPVVPGRIFVAIEAGALVRTFDAGRSWQDRVPDGPYDTHTLASHAGAPGRFYSAAGDGYFESVDIGETWSSDDGGLRHGYLVGVTVDSADPATVLVSASSGPWTAYQPSSAESHVYRRTGKARWRAVQEGLPGPRGTTVSHFATSDPAGLIYAANNRGLFASSDAGQRWTAVDLPWEHRFESETVQAVVAVPD